uniref:Speckle-type POZ protein (inferred by orthology to a human protein) n=1 Tax=Strongyloides papillosus TaxID=174720 RepID=A0A0N5BPA0_STREA
MSSIKSSMESDGQFGAKKNIERDSFIWTIEKSSISRLTGKETKMSPFFDSKNNDTVQWNLQIHQNDVSSNNENYISLSLVLIDVNCIEVTALCSFYVLSVDGEKKHKKVMSIKKFNDDIRIHTCKQFLKRDILHRNDNKLFPNGNLIVGCEIFYYYGTINTVAISTNNNLNGSLNVLLNDIADMLGSSELSDCVIKVGDSEIKVHKFVLASRSEVFSLILTNEDYKSNPNVIKINDFRLEVVKEMITYLYTGKSPNMDKMACEMLEIGEEYKLGQLKLMAEESLLHSLSIKNVCYYLVCSEVYSGGILQEWCLRFIYLHAKEIIDTKGWGKVVNAYPLLAAKLLSIAVN